MGNTCSNCYDGCIETTSDKCVKYTGLDITLLGIKNGDSINYVTAAIAGFLVSVLDGSGVIYDLEPENLCAIISTKLEDCSDISQRDISNALSLAICEIDVRLAQVETDFQTLEGAYTPGCVTGIVGTEGTHAVLQAVLNYACTLNTNLSALELDLETNYVLISDINTYIADYITNNPSGGSATGQKAKMLPYTVVEYYGPLNVFDVTGAGIDDWAEIYLCNGNNGTPDKRGRIAVGATTGMFGGAFPSATDPLISGNPSYSLYDVFGANNITLTETQLPSHTHTASVSTNGVHTHTINADGGSTYHTGGNVRRESGNNGTITTNESGSHTHTATINYTGGGEAHSNVPPVLACYYIMYIPSV